MGDDKNNPHRVRDPSELAAGTIAEFTVSRSSRELSVPRKASSQAFFFRWVETNSLLD